MNQGWIGIDTGGTFTDLVLATSEGRYWFHKIPTSPADASTGILSGIEELLAVAGMQTADVGFLCHGTTLATNAVLEGKWARTGMITTAGFGDVLELARQRRPSFFNLDIAKPTPPAERDVRIEVRERLAYDGSCITALDEHGVRAAVEAIRKAGCAAVSICFLHAYANPAHERRAATIAFETWPDAYVCTSADVLAEFREYERFATTTVNASLLPVIDTYLERFERGVADLTIPVEPRIMQSNGGAVSPSAVRRMPINTFFSGPAGGVIGAASLAMGADVPHVITFDMGGTSTDVSLVKNGQPGKRNVREMGGFPVRTRTLDIHTIGAGGGSIAWVDPGGLLKVGPRSAGASPGPACYGRGGERPTVTDANMILGRLNQTALLGGRMPIHVDRARKTIEQELCAPLGLSPTEAAAGVLDIVNASMMGAVRVISVEQGEDPRHFALMAFGGAGPLHACDVARSIDMKKVFVPLQPGLFSALGLLHANTRGDFSLTVLARAEEASVEALNEGLRQLNDRAIEWLATESTQGTSVLREWQVDIRYFGQNFEMSAPLDYGYVDAKVLDALVEYFHTVHKQTYGYRMTGRTVEIVNLRTSVTVMRHPPPGAEGRRQRGHAEDAICETRKTWFARRGFIEIPIYWRDRLPPGCRFSGPAIIEQMDATTLVPPDSNVHLDELGNLMIEVGVDDAAAA